MKQDASFGLIPMYRESEFVEFLLIQHVAGHWAFPKGHAENKETPLQTAQREFEEETGIKQYQVDTNISFSEEYYPQKNNEVIQKKVTYYPAWVSDKNVHIQEEEVSDYGWFDYKTALEKITFLGSKKIIKKVKKYLDQDL